jgi:hypothetical protein
LPAAITEKDGVVFSNGPGSFGVSVELNGLFEQPTVNNESALQNAAAETNRERT